MIVSFLSTASALRGQRDEKIAHAPTLLIPKSDTWAAIQYVYDWFAALVPAAGAAPKDAQYLVGASDATLTAERVVTGTGSVAWDLATPGQAKANVPALGIATAMLADAAVTAIKITDGIITTAKLAAAAFSTSATLAENSDTVIPSQKAVKAYVDALASLVSGALVFKGSFDASSGSFPGGGVAQTGWFYKVSVAGTVNGQAFDVGDDLYAIVNNASTATYAANWLLIQGVLSNAEIIAALSAGAITYAKIQNVAGLSVFGRSANSSGVGADMTGTLGQVMRIGAGPVAGFGQVDLSSAAAVVNQLQAASMPALTGAIQSAGGALATTETVDLIVIIGDGTNVITTGAAGNWLEVDFAFSIVQWSIIAKQSGSISIDLWRTTHTLFDSGGTHPVAADKISATAPITFSSATKGSDATLTGWTKTIAAQDILAFNIASVTTCTQVVISLKVTKTS